MSKRLAKMDRSVRCDRNAVRNDPSSDIRRALQRKQAKTSKQEKYSSLEQLARPIYVRSGQM
jgi:hypothetical protein